MNPEADQLTVWTAPAAVGRIVDDVLRFLDDTTRRALETPIRRVLREGVGVELPAHTLLLARDGRDISVADSSTPMRGKEGTLHGVVMGLRDITRREQPERNIHHAKQTAEAAYLLKVESLAT